MASRWSIFHLMALLWWTRLATCIPQGDHSTHCPWEDGMKRFNISCSNIESNATTVTCKRPVPAGTLSAQLKRTCIEKVTNCLLEKSDCLHTYNVCLSQPSNRSCVGQEFLWKCNISEQKGPPVWVLVWQQRKATVNSTPTPMTTQQNTPVSAGTNPETDRQGNGAGSETSGGSRSSNSTDTASGGSRSSNSAGTAVGITFTMLILIGGGVAVAWLFKTGRLTMERIRTTAEDALAMIRSRLGRKEGENIGQQRDSSPDRGGRAPGQIEDCSYASIGAEAIPSAPPVPSSSLSSAADGSGPPPWARHVSGHAPAAPALPDGDYLMPVEEKMKFQSEATARRESKAVSDSYTPENEYLAPVEELRRAQDRYTASPISAAVRKTPKTERYAGSGLPALPSRPGDHTYDLPERRLYQFAPDA